MNNLLMKILSVVKEKAQYYFRLEPGHLKKKTMWHKAISCINSVLRCIQKNAERGISTTDDKTIIKSRPSRSCNRSAKSFGPGRPAQSDMDQNL